MRFTFEQRTHLMVADDNITPSMFHQRLIDDQIMRMRHHARVMANHLAVRLVAEGYGNHDKVSITRVFIEREMKRAAVDPLMRNYFTKILFEKAQERWQ